MPNGRCRMHGGLSPGAPKGNQKCPQAWAVHCRSYRPPPESDHANPVGPQARLLMVKNEYSQHDRYEAALAALRDTRSAVGTTGWRCTGRRRRRAPLSGLWRIAQREQAEDAGSEARLTGTGAGRWERELSLRRDGTFARAPPYPSIPQGWLSDTERSTRQGRIVDPEPIELKPLRFHAIGHSTIAMSDISITHLQLLNEFALRVR